MIRASSLVLLVPLFPGWSVDHPGELHCGTRNHIAGASQRNISTLHLHQIFTANNTGVPGSKGAMWILDYVVGVVVRVHRFPVCSRPSHVVHSSSRSCQRLVPSLRCRRLRAEQATSRELSRGGARAGLGEAATLERHLNLNYSYTHFSGKDGGGVCVCLCIRVCVS